MRFPISMAAAAAMLATVAVTADTAWSAEPVPYAAYNWTGAYAGAQLGWGWASEQITHITPGAAFPSGYVDNPINTTGALGGFYGGYNYQMKQFLIGIDGDYTFSDLSGSGSDLSAINGDTAQHVAGLDWSATLTGRLGFANGDWLFFAKGGWAWASFNGSSILYAPSTKVVNTSIASTTRDGWTTGAGLEWGFAAHWSAKLEYDYVKFNTENFNTTEIAAGGITFPTRSATSSLNMLKAGVSYRL